MGMSQIHNFSFMIWRSRSPNIPCLTGVHPGASPSSDKVIKKPLKTASRWIKTFPWSKCRFFFFSAFAGWCGSQKAQKKCKKSLFFSLPQAASSIAKVRTRQRTHCQRTRLRVPDPLASTYRYCYFIFSLHFNYTITEVSS